MPWLDTRSSARFLDLSEARFLALVRGGRMPAPSYHLGERSPRWSSEALAVRLKQAMESGNSG